MPTPLQIAPEEAQEKFKEKMVEIAIKDQERAVQRHADELHIGYINLKGFPIGPEVLVLIPENVARDLKIVAFFKEEQELRVGAVDPANEHVLAFLENLTADTKVNVVPYLISEHSLELALRLYAAVPKVKKFTSGVQVSPEDLEKFKKELKSIRELEAKLREVSLTQVITLLIAGAVISRSSDIHIEAEEKTVLVRYRIDGVLHEIAHLPVENWKKIISRVKLLAHLKLNITQKPQDGRFTIYLDKETIDVRASTLPTTFGESVVMRLLMSSAIGLKLEDLGMRPSALAIIKKQVQRPNGMVLTTGPTGSGKTTTLYAFLTTLNKPDTNIITLENPVEYHLAGINQSQVNEEKDYTFAKGLRSIMRQDPDVVMVGEIRDGETAEIATNAALTGHLMLSTLHTNDAAGAIPRLIALGVKPFLLAPALNVIIGQRLVRRICQKCKTKAAISVELLERAKEALGKISPTSGEKVDMQNLVFYKGQGCEACQGIGYRGRIGIYEILVMNSEIEKIILSAQVSEYDIRDIAARHGMLTMAQDGLLKALEGITTLEEVFQVIE
ncbi:type II/IV secretion system protein [Candidatus Parcubacteria bacterium]|nr:MAG: type II/IV secretion system protein [Candidatus Parcubacteria bacterium]